MFLFVLHLDKTGKMPDVLEVLTENKITGCTIIDTIGIGHSTFLKTDEPVIASMSHLFGPDRQYNKTVLAVIEDEKSLNKVMDGIEKRVGNFNKPDTGLMYSIAINRIVGYRIDFEE